MLTREFADPLGSSSSEAGVLRVDVLPVPRHGRPLLLARRTERAQVASDVRARRLRFRLGQRRENRCSRRQVPFTALSKASSMDGRNDKPSATSSMDSFVLSETFKYLYLIFAEPSEIPINLDDYLFTTEAHFLPLSISRYSPPNKTVVVSKSVR